MKRIKKTAIFIFVLALCISCLSALLTASADNFAGGSGTTEDPYMIATKEQLNNVRNYKESCFILTADIEFAASDFETNGDFYNGDAGWEPIGTSAAPFAGVFDGNGHTISGLTQNTVLESTIYAGLFGRVSSSCVIKNLGVLNCVFTSEAASDLKDVYLGSIAGYSQGTIEDCYCFNDLTGYGTSTNGRTSVGGIVGYNSGTVQRCYNGYYDGYRVYGVNTRSDGGNAYVGGIVGSNTGDVINCYNTGTVKAYAWSCYAYAGGIVGENAGTIQYCYNTGSITSDDSFAEYAGGILGMQSSDDAVSDVTVGCYYLKGSAGRGIGYGTANFTVLESSAMKLQSSFTGFDFTNTWTMAGNSEYLYPELVGVSMIYEATATDIAITVPTKTEYIEGEELDLTGGRVKITFDGGTFTQESAMQASEVTGFDNTKLGAQTLTVTREGISATFEVTVVAKSVSSIEVSEHPTKSWYIAGESASSSGGKITLKYNNNTSETIDMTDDMLSALTSEPGEQTVTVTYEGNTAEFTVNVYTFRLESENDTLKLTYKNLPTNSMVIAAQYNAQNKLVYTEKADTAAESHTVEKVEDCTKVSAFLVDSTTLVPYCTNEEWPEM